MNKKIVKESVGRDLVGASNYASRSSVTHKILLKYPNPTALSAALAQMGKDSSDPRVQKKCAELAAKCQGVDIQQYPDFVQKVAGLSKLWSVAAKTIGAATAAAGTYYLVRTMADVAGSDAVKNADGIGGKAEALMKGTGSQISSDVGALKQGAVQGYEDIKKWGANKAKEAATAVSKKADELSGAKADRASIKKSAAEETSARKAGDTAVAAKAAADTAAEANARQTGDKSVAAKAAADTAAEADARKAGDSSLQAQANLERKQRQDADAQETAARMRADAKETVARKQAVAAEANARRTGDAKLNKTIADEMAAERNARQVADDAATADRAAIRKDTTKGFEKTRRRINSLQPKVEPEKPSVPVSDMIPSKEDIKQAYVDAYGPTIKRAQELSSAAYDKTKATAKGWLERLGQNAPTGVPNAFGVPALYR